MYSELLANDMIAPEKRAWYLHTLCDQSDRLTHLIDNVLTFARLERKALAKSKTKVTLDELTGLTIDKPLERAKDAGFEIDLQLDDSLRSMELDTDISSVEQIVSNLIDNAIKYASSVKTSDCGSLGNGMSVSWCYVSKTMDLESPMICERSCSVRFRDPQNKQQDQHLELG